MQAIKLLSLYFMAFRKQKTERKARFLQEYTFTVTYRTPPQYIALKMVNAIVALAITKRGAYLEIFAAIKVDTVRSS
ncbi:hypothetical protein ATN88_02990 [Enterovibrio coralii]|uniref:Uncharacterized protein n=1 Tax=Enterovibrio coralii TaxID=294935 RepID=A0A135I872_9GAMM|nr:hypothetical protein ATN88_02990 [Enterovibrio coralii]